MNNEKYKMQHGKLNNERIQHLLLMAKKEVKAYLALYVNTKDRCVERFPFLQTGTKYWSFFYVASTERLKYVQNHSMKSKRVDKIQDRWPS
jgi:hypothetical protein